MLIRRREQEESGAYALALVLHFKTVLYATPRDTSVKLFFMSSVDLSGLT